MSKYLADWQSQFGLECQAEELGPYSLGSGETLEMGFAHRRNVLRMVSKLQTGVHQRVQED